MSYTTRTQQTSIWSCEHLQKQDCSLLKLKMLAVLHWLGRRAVSPPKMRLKGLLHSQQQPCLRISSRKKSSQLADAKEQDSSSDLRG